MEIKSYANARLFLDIGDYKSAVIAFRNSASDFPDTKFAEEMEFLTIKAQAMYAKASLEMKQEVRYIEAINLFTEFAKNYPSSKYLKDGEEIKKNSEKAIVEVKKLIAMQEAEMKILQDKAKAVEAATKAQSVETTKNEETKNK